MIVKDFMQSDVFHIGPQATLLEAAQKLLSCRVDTLLILKGDALVGVIGLRDLFTAPIPAHYGGSMPAHHDEGHLIQAWKATPVKHLMNEKVISVTEETPLLRGAELMVNSGKHPLAVLRNGKVVGVISRSDIAHALLEQT
jgi:CBS domain-containing protein